MNDQYQDELKTSLDSQWACDPLESFCRRHGRPAPDCQVLNVADIPSPYHDLLVHKDDMTPILQAYHKQPLVVRVLDKDMDRNWLVREVVLIGELDQVVAEYGAIRIRLDRFDADPRGLITECRQPLGAILEQFQIKHQSRPTQYFRVEADHVMQDTLSASVGQWLFGRRNILSDAEGELLALVVEVLPPNLVPR
ncbi:MAG: hypothetical protein CMJ20_08785 [Phycisphaeraceae bacterium]|nr:hypothetical protein [Phycisphaeraceae bacterium]|tara:strand:- start:5233 stop:5817 length:585 start_codon:yes stop_codon:yes gene_type:complete